MKWLSVAILIAVACRPAEKSFHRVAPFKPGVLKIHLAQETPAPGLQNVVLADRTETIYINSTPELTEKQLRKITVWRGKGEDRILALTFTEEGAEALARVTAANVGKRLAFMVDGRVVTAPVIQSEITGGDAVIEAGFTEQEAEHLAKKLFQALNASHVSLLLNLPAHAGPANFGVKLMRPGVGPAAELPTSSPA